MPRSGDVAIVGATGAVGREALQLLSARGVHPGRVRALASARSAGGSVGYGTERIGVGLLESESFEGVGVAVFAACAATARAHAGRAVGAGAFVVDNSSAYRLDPAVPLVVPEVNGDTIDGHRLVANPNCTTIILLTAVEPLRRRFGVEGLDVVTYQAVSGAGSAGIEELLGQTRREVGSRGGFENAEALIERGRVFGEPCAFNVFSHDSQVECETGVNGEERKVIEETRRIWNDPCVRVTPTCVRVPVLRAHTEAVTVTLGRPAGESEVRSVLAAGEGLEVLDDRAGNAFPTPRKSSGRDPVSVGRVRPDPGTPLDREGRTRRWCMLVCGDQLRKGAALNALQIVDRAGAWRAATFEPALSGRPT